MHVGIVGGGYWGSKHVRVLAGMAEVDSLTLVEQNAERAKELKASFPMINTADSLEAVLDDLDGVVVATRPRSHFELGRQILSAGKHALIEKPMTTSIAEAVELRRLADEKGVALMAGHTFEFNPTVIELKRRIDSGELGAVQYVRSLRLNLGLYQNDINVIWDLAPHDVSIINFLLDDAPSVITAWGHHSTPTEFEDVAMIRLEYERSNVQAFVHVSWLDPSKVREVTVVGSKKMAVYDDVRPQEQLRLFDQGVVAPQDRFYEAPLSYRYGDIVSPFIQPKEPLAAEDEHFIAAMKTGRATKSNSDSGYRVVVAMEAAQRSLATGAPVRLADLDPDYSPVIDLTETTNVDHVESST